MGNSDLIERQMIQLGTLYKVGQALFSIARAELMDA
jgi:hypothetical protein